jgi:gliding motility-associated protein GldL
MALINKRVMNFAYGMGAAVVIVGALFKIQHWKGASEFLIIGLLTEAFIFALSAFDPVDTELDWSLVYPELAGGDAKKKEAKKENPAEAQGLLSQKLDAMLKDAKIDGAMMASLGNSIKNFESAAKGIGGTVDSIASTKKYSDEMSLAATQMESLNASYKLQLQSAEKHTQINQDVAENNLKLKDQMQSLTSNLSSLNNVYGGMLSAMSNKQ